DSYSDQDCHYDVSMLGLLHGTDRYTKDLLSASHGPRSFRHGLCGGKARARDGVRRRWAASAARRHAGRPRWASRPTTAPAIPAAAAAPSGISASASLSGV